MLPAIADLAAYRLFKADLGAQRAALAVVCARHHLPASELTPFRHGTQVVWSVGGDVIKLFVPLWPEDARVEIALLERAAGAGVAVPAFRAQGELDGWPYVVMRRVDGVRIGDAWPTLDVAGRQRLAFSAGEAMAALASLPVDGLDWRAVTQDDLLAERRTRLVRDQLERGGDAALSESLQRFLDVLEPLAPAPSVVLHADLTDDHFLVEGTRVTGVIDFADAFVGPWTYELAAPACFVTRGDVRAQAALLEGYGVAPSRDLCRAIRAWAVLHRYGHVAIMMRRSGIASFGDWLDAVWPT